MPHLHLHFLCVLNKVVSRMNLCIYDQTRLFYTVRVRTLLQDALHESRYEYTALYRTFLCAIVLSFQANCAVEETRAESTNANVELRFVWLTNPARRSAQSPPADKLNLQA